MSDASGRQAARDRVETVSGSAVPAAPHHDLDRGDAGRDGGDGA